MPLPPAAPPPPAPLWADASLDDLLALAGKKYALEFEPISVGGIELAIAQIANMRELLDAALAKNALRDALHTLPLWAKIWPASMVLTHVLTRIPQTTGGTVLEIGAGCGVCGLAAAACGFKRVCISDIDEDALLFARINVLKNNLQDRVDVRRVDIRSDRLEERFSLILGSEILYLDHLYRPLAVFLQRHLRPAGSTPAPEVYLAADHRRTAKPFFKQAKKNFQIAHRQIGTREKTADDPSGTAPERHLLTLYRLSPL